MTEQNSTLAVIDPSPFRRLGFWAVMLGAIGMVCVLIHAFGPSLQPTPSIGDQIGEIAGDIRRSAWRSFLGLAPPEPEPVPTTNYFGFAGPILGVVAIVLALVSSLSGENWRYAAYGTALGAGAILMHFFLWVALLITGVMLLIAILGNIGDIFSG